ncbi:MAG: hypothetical protein L3J42_03065 [Hydrogenimonas sp.]|nr:hypothetical protein [Hydrogenimonas sp.]
MKSFNLTIAIFVLLTIVGLAIRYGLGADSALWSFWSNLDISFAVALGVLAFLAYRDMLHDEDEVRLFFDVEGRKVDTGLCLLRKDCTRSEIIGVLGMMQRRTKERFAYDAKHLRGLLNELNRVQKGKESRLYIPLSKEEFEQFALSLEQR